MLTDVISLPSLEWCSPAVIPVVANLGTALLPALFAGLGTVAALVFKPKQLFRACRANPGRALGTAVGMAAALALGWWVFMAPGPETPADGRRPGLAAVTGGGAATDWTKVALELIRSGERRPAAVAIVAPTTGETVAIPPVTSAVPVRTAALLFRADAARSGHGGGAAPKNLKPVWEYSEDNTMYLSAPLVADGYVFGASCYLDPPKTYGSVFCLDVATGKVVWNVATVKGRDGKDVALMGFFSSPTLSADGTSLLIGQGLHPDKDAALLCFDAATGALRWSAPTTLHIESSPVIVGDLVVAGAGAIENPTTHIAIGDPGYVFAVRLSDGVEVWRHALNDPESSPVAGPDGVIYIGSGFNGKAVVALRTASDDELKAKGQTRLMWTVPTPHPATGAVTLVGDLVLAGCGNGDFVFAAKDPSGLVIAIDRATGAVRWRCELPDAVLGSIAVRDGVAYCPVRNGELVAIDVATGALRWRQQEPAKRLSRKSPLLAGPAVVDGLIYAVSGDGYLGIFDATNGTQIERTYLNAKNKPGEMGLSLSSPWVVDGRVYVGSETGGLRCYAGTP